MKTLVLLFALFCLGPCSPPAIAQVERPFAPQFGSALAPPAPVPADRRLLDALERIERRLASAEASLERIERDLRSRPR